MSHRRTSEVDSQSSNQPLHKTERSVCIYVAKYIVLRGKSWCILLDYNLYSKFYKNFPKNFWRILQILSPELFFRVFSKFLIISVFFFCGIWFIVDCYNILNQLLQIGAGGNIGGGLTGVKGIQCIIRMMRDLQEVGRFWGSQSGVGNTNDRLCLSCPRVTALGCCSDVHEGAVLDEQKVNEWLSLTVGIQRLSCNISLWTYHGAPTMVLRFKLRVSNVGNPACDNKVWVIKEWVTIIFTWV